MSSSRISTCFGYYTVTILPSFAVDLVKYRPGLSSQWCYVDYQKCWLLQHGPLAMGHTVHGERWVQVSPQTETPTVDIETKCLTSRHQKQSLFEQITARPLWLLICTWSFWLSQENHWCLTFNTRGTRLLYNLDKSIFQYCKLRLTIIYFWMSGLFLDLSFKQYPWSVKWLPER